MPIYVRCQSCGHLSKSPQDSTDPVECRYCGRTIDASTSQSQPAPDDVLEEQLQDEAPSTEPTGAHHADEQFESADSAAPASAPKNQTLHRMFQALLDPHSIQWMLMIGGALCVLGLVVWLVSLGVFKDPHVLAVTLGVGTLAILALGWFFTLRTRFRLAGQAITFLGFFVAPLNFCLYHAQGFFTVDVFLWVGGVFCCRSYA